MLHGKWYRGIDDLSPIGREFNQRDIGRWHLHITQDGTTIGYCAMEPLCDGWHIITLEYASPLTLDLIMRQIQRKLEGFGVSSIMAKANKDLDVFGFKAANAKTVKAEPIILPKFCKE